MNRRHGRSRSDTGMESPGSGSSDPGKRSVDLNSLRSEKINKGVGIVVVDGGHQWQSQFQRKTGKVGELSDILVKGWI